VTVSEVSGIALAPKCAAEVAIPGAAFIASIAYSAYLI